MRQNVSLYGNVLTLCRSIPTFKDPEKESFGKYCRERRKCWKAAFFPFPTLFSAHPKKNFSYLSYIHFVECKLPSILDQSKIMSIGKRLHGNEYALLDRNKII